jgi:hypothetical protein
MIKNLRVNEFKKKGGKISFRVPLCCMDVGMDVVVGAVVENISAVFIGMIGREL